MATEDDPQNDFRPDVERPHTRFEELIIDGFKSFADRVRLKIDPGLTGVVGPNGCGKSNVTEALRLVLGETSSKRLRGDGMDMMIFGGSEKRPPKSACEVTLVLDNSTRNAPEGMNDSDVIRVTRRIERGNGTQYRVNGKPSRLKDLQLLYKDNATGPSSGSIIGQSRVSELMKAKAEDRSFILHEAAGVTGILQRKHEAELELRAADENLGKADEAFSSTTSRVTTLRRQARQVERLRLVETDIHDIRTRLAINERLRATTALAGAREQFEMNERRIGEAILEERRRFERQGDVARALPALRDARTRLEVHLAEARTKLTSIEDEGKRIEIARKDLERRIAETTRDIETANAAILRERTRQSEREALLAKLRQESAAEPAAITEAEQACERLLESRRTLATRLEEHLAAGARAKASLDETRRRREREVAALVSSQSARTKAADGLEKARLLLSQTEDPTEAEAMIAGLEEEEAILRDSLERLDEERGVTRERLAALRNDRAGIDGALASLTGEESTLRRAAGPDIDAAAVDVTPGFESAVAAAIGAALSAGSDPSADRFWGSPSATPPSFAEGTQLLGDVASPPDHLSVAFRSVALVEPEDFDRIAASLPRGGSVVDRNGRFATWTGWHSTSGDPMIEAELRRRSRLAEIAIQGEDLKVRLQAANAALATATERDTEEQGRLTTSQERLRVIGPSLMSLRRGRLESETARSRAGLEITSRTDEITRLDADIAQRTEEISTCDTILAANDLGPDYAETETRLREDLKLVSEDASSASIRLDRMRREAETRRQAIVQASDEFEAARVAVDEGQERVEDLLRRKMDLEDGLAGLPVPDPDVSQLEAARLAVTEAEAQASECQMRLADLEKERETSDQALREAAALHASLVEARERFREAIMRAQGDAEKSLAALVALGHENDAAPDAERLDDSTILELDSRLADLERTRQSIGAVNHLAETELKEHEGRLGDIEKARKETIDAIRTLRKAIAEIEEDARNRLAPTFDRMNEHFGMLFRRIFNGGKAHLRLTGDDILTAGMEVFIAPPGKLMQTLSLFSGGERALSSIAMIFSAFLINPSPICILDEADADLDEANVVRLYDLVRYMAAGDATRFVVISHKPVAMAKMDRLYGVTMQEGGVSMLASVDIGAAIEMVPGTTAFSAA